MSKLHFVPKGWGYEKWIVNNEKYCGKILFVVKDRKCSLHYHKIKDETFYVQNGKIVLHYGMDEKTARNYWTTLGRGDTFHIPVGMIHQFSALKDSEIIEISTQHFDEDSYRIEKGD